MFPFFLNRFSFVFGDFEAFGREFPLHQAIRVSACSSLKGGKRTFVTGLLFKKAAHARHWQVLEGVVIYSDGWKANCVLLNFLTGDPINSVIFSAYDHTGSDDDQGNNEFA